MDNLFISTGKHLEIELQDRLNWIQSKSLHNYDPLMAECHGFILFFFSCAVDQTQVFKHAEYTLYH